MFVGEQIDAEVSTGFKFGLTGEFTRSVNAVLGLATGDTALATVRIVAEEIDAAIVAVL